MVSIFTDWDNVALFFSHSLDCWKKTFASDVKHPIPEISIEWFIVVILPGTPGSMNRFFYIDCFQPVLNCHCNKLRSIVRYYYGPGCFSWEIVPLVLRSHPELWIFFWPSNARHSLLYSSIKVRIIKGLPSKVQPVTNS